MQIGIFAKTFSGQGALQVLGAARAVGFETVQFNMACVGLPSMPEAIDASIAASIAKASIDTGVSIAAVSGTYNMIHPDLAQRAAGLRQLGVILGAARAMGARLVTLCTGTRDAQDQWRHHPDNSSASAWRDLCTEMAKAAALADAHDIDLGIEPELANVISNAPAARRLLDEMRSPRLRIVLDPANLFETASEQGCRDLIARAVDLLADRIVMAHAKDRDARGGFVAAGRGVIDFAHFIKRLRAAGFDGPLVTHGLSEAEAPAVAAFLKQVTAA
jgi:sugar phosphate isomerase/epimerase